MDPKAANTRPTWKIAPRPAVYQDEASNMKKLRKAVESAFDIPFDCLGLPATLQRLDPAEPGGFLYGSPEAATRGVLLQSDIDAFVTQAPTGLNFWPLSRWGSGATASRCRIRE
jgi:hypothetical protein